MSKPAPKRGLNKSHRHKLLLFSIGPITVLVLLLVMLFSDNIQNLEWDSLNARFETRGHQPSQVPIYIIGIDSGQAADDYFMEDEIEQHEAIQGMVHFPYSRRALALTAERLLEAGAKVVALDLILNNPSSYGPEDDPYLRQVIEKHKDRIVLGADIQTTSSRTGNSQIVESTPESVVDESLMKDVAGYVNYPATRKGFVYYAQPFQKSPINKLKSFALLIASKFDPSLTAAESDEVYYINFLGPNVVENEAFPIIPIFEIWNDFKSKSPWHTRFKSGAFFKDSIVLIGPTGVVMHDDLLAPFGYEPKYQKLFGVVAHANTIHTLLTGSHYRSVSNIWFYFAPILTGILVGAVLSYFQRPWAKLLLLVAVAGLYLLIVQFLFNHQRLLLPVSTVILVVAFAGFFGIFTQLILEQVEKFRVRRTLEQYVSKNVAAEILKNSEDYAHSLYGQRKDVTILFSDIRGFTTLTEITPEQELVEQLNEYFERMVSCVMRHGGTLHKFIGDGILAAWGDTHSEGREQDAWQAVQCAMAMRKELEVLNQFRAEKGRGPFHIGIGLNHGSVIVGDVGSPQRKEYTVIGDPVNVAARTESETKNQQTDILLTQTVHDLVKEKISAEFKGSIKVKGRNEPVGLYALKDLVFKSEFQNRKQAA